MEAQALKVSEDRNKQRENTTASISQHSVLIAEIGNHRNILHGREYKEI